MLVTLIVTIWNLTLLQSTLLVTTRFTNPGVRIRNWIQVISVFGFKKENIKGWIWFVRKWFGFGSGFSQRSEPDSQTWIIFNYCLGSWLPRKGSRKKSYFSSFLRLPFLNLNFLHIHNALPSSEPKILFVHHSNNQNTDFL